MGGLAELISATRHDRLVVVEKSLDELEDNPVNDYVMRKLGSINLAELSKNFGLQVTYPLAFIDIETTGIKRVFSIASLAYTLVEKDNLTSTCIFPPTFRLEKEALIYFFQNVGNGTLFTWNGASFDIPRISDRARQRGVVANGSPETTFREHVKDRHVDLCRKRKEFGLPSGKGYGKLQTLERVEFGYEREDDIPGKMIPQAYRTWVHTRTNPEEIAQLIEHNIQDTVSLLAIMLRFCELCPK